MKKKIFIVDDHPMMRDGLAQMISNESDLSVCGEAENGREAVQFVSELKPDIVILDVTMPTMSGLEAAEEIAKLRLNSRVLIFTMHDSGSLAKAVRRAGARGIVLKSRAARDLIRAIETLLDGGTFWGPGLGADAEDPKPDGWNMLLFRGSRLGHGAQLAVTC